MTNTANMIFFIAVAGCSSHTRDGAEARNLRYRVSEKAQRHGKKYDSELHGAQRGDDRSAALVQLLREHGIAVPADLDRARSGRHVLVLEDGDELIAAAVLQIAAGHGHLVALAVAHAERAVEDRMIGVAEALCDAFGADLDIGSRAA